MGRRFAGFVITRTLQIDGQTLELCHTPPRSLTEVGHIEGTIIQALRHLGLVEIDMDIIARLRQT